jgi:hypothetical protein
VGNGFGFTRLPDRPGRTITIEFEGAPVSAQEGDSVTAARLAAGHAVTRTTPVRGTTRGPFCMMGVCFDCLLEIDGQPNRQGCAVLVSEGLRVRRMDGSRSLTVEPEDG